VKKSLIVKEVLKVFLWKRLRNKVEKNMPPYNVRTRAVNIISHIPVPKQNTRRASSENE
jgi:hypothetical protein